MRSFRLCSRRAVLCRRGMSTGKDIYFGITARAMMLEGVDKLTDAVKVTLGPKAPPIAPRHFCMTRSIQGRNVVLDHVDGPRITKDGVSVAKHIDFEHPAHDMGAQLVREVADETNHVAGDGL